jgi:hypothetical protein
VIAQFRPLVIADFVSNVGTERLAAALRPEKVPVDPVIFTGRVYAGKFQRDHSSTTLR